MLAYIYSLATDKRRGFIASSVKLFLYIVSFIYGLAVMILVFIYGSKPYRLKCKVISVGNITLGGTGKTSLVLLIARYLKEKGHKVAILTRGYKRKITNCRLPITDYEKMGDEPYMLKVNLKDVPVLVDTDRVKSANFAMREYGVDTVILDDGFQQWRIKKDLDIVAIDATCPFGNRKLIPRGILREPIFSLRRADMFVLTKTDLVANYSRTKDSLSSLKPKALIVDSMHSPVGFRNLDSPVELLDVNTMQGKSVALFSAIGDPESFESIIRNLGITIGLSFRFRDHHNYTREELDNIISKSKEAGIDTLVTTEKDASRLYELRITNYELRLLFLRIELKIIKNEQGFLDRLLGLYSY